ncbi:MAG: Asp23/Gls24 family envelope stress response protein [Clostridiales bacterium]|nr:Asp23/Gls24 family envelope stress response protein [Clostridiales bacterium]
MAQLRSNKGENETLINKNMVVSIVSLATKEIKGVKNVYKSKRLGFLKIFNKNIGQGVKIKYTATGLLIDIYIVVDTDVEVNDVVYKIQQNVKNSIKTLLPNQQIKSINVHVMDASKPSL